jgi:hypothetical protein
LVALVFLCEGGLATILAWLVTGFRLEQCRFIVDDFGGFGEVDFGARLARGFVISC